MRPTPKNCGMCGTAFGTRHESITLCAACRRLRDRATTARNVRQEERESAARIRALNNPKMRACLYCGCVFHSAGAFNRVCARCKRSESYANVTNRRIPSVPPASACKVSEFLYEGDEEAKQS